MRYNITGTQHVIRTLPIMLNIIYVLPMLIGLENFSNETDFHLHLVVLEVVDVVKFGENTLCVYVCGEIFCLALKCGR
jgi:hypothetical protein